MMLCVQQTGQALQLPHLVGSSSHSAAGCPGNMAERSGQIQEGDSMGVEVVSKRSSSYYKNYRQRRKQKALAMNAQIEEMRRQVKQLKLEQICLIYDSQALENCYAYSNAMFSVAGFAAEQFQWNGRVPTTNLQVCADQQWVIPSGFGPEACVLSSNTENTGSILRILLPQAIINSKENFIKNLKMVLHEVTNTHDNITKKLRFDMERSVSYWAQSVLALIIENRKVIEDDVCLRQLTQHAAAASAPPAESLTPFPELDRKQVEYFRKQWDEFQYEIKLVHSELLAVVCENRAPLLDAHAFELIGLTGASMGDASKAFLKYVLTTEQIGTCMKKQSRAYLKLFIACLEALTPSQQAHIIINYEPIIPKLPQIFKQMLPDDAQCRPLNGGGGSHAAQYAWPFSRC